MARKRKRSAEKYIEAAALRMTFLVGTPWSILFHTLLFLGVFSLVLLDISLDDILLLLTTAVSLEAIYLALFIQMTVNRQAREIAAVGKDIDELSDDIESLEDLQEDVEDISQDIDRMQKDDAEYEVEEEQKDQATRVALQSIEDHLVKVSGALQSLGQEIENLKKKV